MAFDEYEPDESIRSLDHNAEVKARDGWSVTNRDQGSLEVLINSGNLGSGQQAIRVTSGTGVIDRSTQELTGQVLDIATGDANAPRKDVVYLDATGAAQVEPGDPERQEPTTVSLEDATRPAPPSLAGMDALPLAMVTVPTEATTITASNISDKRVRADREFGHVRSQSSTTDQTVTDADLSVTGGLSRDYYADLVLSDGTHYALYHDGSDMVLVKSTAAVPDDSWTEVNRWAGASDSAGIELKRTASGTMLVGFDGSIRRSTDDGSTWSSVQSLSAAGDSIWSFAENGTGTLLASEYTSSVTLYESTDDGATWTVLADGTTFGEFPNHLHRVRYHPVNDYIIVTGGDGGGRGFYRSTDSGTSWTFHDTDEQLVAIGAHPTDGTTYFVASDESNGTHQSVIRVTDDGSSISSERVQGLNFTGQARNAGSAVGAFGWSTWNVGDNARHVTATVEQDPERLLISDDTEGRNWRTLDTKTYLRNGGGNNVTKQEGAYEHVIDAADVESLILSNRYVRKETFQSYVWGTSANQGVDSRDANADIHFSDPSHQLVDDHPDYSGSVKLWLSVLQNETNISLLRQNGNRFGLYDEDASSYLFYHNTDGALSSWKMPIIVSDAGSGIGVLNAENLTGKTGNYDGEMRMDDGTNTAARMTMCVWDDTNNVWRPMNDPATGSFT